MDIINKHPYTDYDKDTATRVGYGDRLAKIGECSDIVVLDADLGGSCGSAKFGEKFSERYMNVGIQESFMVNMAGGLATCGKIPFVNTFAMFLSKMGLMMIYQTWARPKSNAKAIGSHGGIATGEDGDSHQAIFDMNLLRFFDMLLVEPTDAYQAEQMLDRIALYNGPVYMRNCRAAVPPIHTKHHPYDLDLKNNEPFNIGKAYILNEVEGNADITFLASGVMVNEVLQVAQKVEEKIRVVEVPTQYPLYPETENVIKDVAERSNLLVTAQDHAPEGGILELVKDIHFKDCLKVEKKFVAVQNYAESGTKDDLFDKYGLSSEKIIERFKLKKK